MMIKKNGTGTVIIAYIPVLHEGYRRFFDRHREVGTLFILDDDITKEFSALKKDIRALPAELIKKSLLAWKRFKVIKIIDIAEWKNIGGGKTKIVMPDDEIMRELRNRHIPDTKVIFDSVFLRWDKHKSSEGMPVDVDQIISINESDRQLIKLLKKEAAKSSDFWRHIGAALVREGKIISMTHNHAVPTELMPYIEGDPRSDYHKGVNIELSTVLHAEAGLIADAARKGISLEGTEIYTTTFPCPPCAKLIAYSGIKKLYYADGYGVLDAARILKSKGVEIVFVKTSKT